MLGAIFFQTSYFILDFIVVYLGRWGCVRSSLLHTGFLQFSKWELLFIVVHGLLIVVAFLVVPGGSEGKASAWWATVHGVAKSQTRLSDVTFSCCGAQGSRYVTFSGCSIWAQQWPHRFKPVSPALADRFLSTVLPGKYLYLVLSSYLISGFYLQLLSPQEFVNKVQHHSGLMKTTMNVCFGSHFCFPLLSSHKVN